MDVGKIKGGSAGSVGLTFPMLAKSNCIAWALKMKVFMQAQGVWIVVEPSDPKTIIEDMTNKVALAMIYQGVPEETLLSISYKKRRVKEPRMH